MNLRPAPVIVMILFASLSFSNLQPLLSYAPKLQYGASQVLVSGQATPIGIAVDGAGTVYWANQYNQLLKLPKGAATPTVVLSGLNNVIGLGLDLAGNLYYDEYSLGILYEIPAGSTTPQMLANGLDFPNFLSVDPTGSNVYLVTGQTCGDKIVKYDLASRTFTTVLTAPSPHDTNHGFGGLFIDPSGDLYYTTCAYNTVNRLPAGSSMPLVLVNTPNTPTPWTGSSGITVDSVGNVFYTLYDAVYLLPAGSSTPVLLTSQGCNTHEMALDQDDNVYYTDSCGGMIWKISVQSNSMVTTVAPQSTTVQTQVQTFETGAPSNSYTLPTTSSATTSPLQMPQPPQSTGSQSTSNTLQVGLVVAVIAAVALVAVFMYSKRGKKPKTTKAEKVDSKTEKAVSSKAFCVECGNELPTGSKFCNSCGTKQP